MTMCFTFSLTLETKKHSFALIPIIYVMLSITISKAGLGVFIVNSIVTKESADMDEGEG
jgi:hypothetical protein